MRWRRPAWRGAAGAGAAHERERRVLRRTRLVLAANLTAAVSAVVLLVAGLAYLVTGQRMDSAADRYLSVALGQDTGGVKYSCLWLVTLRDGRWDGVADAPAGLPKRDTMLAVAAGGPAVQERVTVDGREFLVRTERVGDQVRQAVFDTVYLRDDLSQLLVALAVAGLVGLVGAGAVGAVASHRAIAPLAEALDRQRRFVADASHELRAPLTRLHTRSQLLLRRETELSPALAAELRRLAEGTRELGEVVDDLLRTARLRAGPPDAERVDLAALTAGLLAAEAGRLAERGLAADVTADPATPAVAGVSASLRRMVSALVDNAIAHTPPGGRIAVAVGPAADGPAVHLTVADTGVGLDPALRRTLFQRFARGTGGAGPRHGLGLALAREVADGHGGTITAAPRPGGGTAFVVRLPAAPPRPGDAEPPAAAGTGPDVRERGRAHTG